MHPSRTSTRHLEGRLARALSRASLGALWLGALRLCALLLLVWAGASGCESTAVGSVTPLRDLLMEDGEAWVHPLPDGRLLTRRDGLLLLLDPSRPSAEPLAVAPEGSLGEIRASVSLDGSILVLGREGAAVLSGDAWLSSEILDALDAPVRAAVTVPRGGGEVDLWIATDATLYRYRDGLLRALDLGAADLSSAQLAVGRSAGGPALWVLLEDRVLEVASVGSEVRAARVLLDTHPDQIAADATGVVWMIAGGQLSSIGADRVLRSFGIAASSIHARPASAEAWFLGPDGRPTVHTADGFFASSEALSAAATEGAAEGAVAVGVDGALYVAADAALSRYAARHPLDLGGPAAGSVLVAPERFLILASGEGLRARAEIDGQSVEVLEDPLRVEVVPAELGDGPHTLVVRVRHGDGTLPSEARRELEVISSATWGEDVGPLYEAHCSGCHGPEGPANTRLDQPEGWEPIVETIVANVRDGRMPLGREPLTQREIALIQAWQVAGFPD